jgi:hypothetical protein
VLLIDAGSTDQSATGFPQIQHCANADDMAIETELRHLPSRGLEWLQRGLRRQPADLPVGSPASRLVGRLCRLARSELRRRRACDPPQAA